MPRKENFECDDCDHRWFEPSFSKRSDGHYGPRGKRLSCPECGTWGVSHIPFEEATGATFGKFESSTPSEKAEILRKRSRDHYRKEIHEKAVEMDRHPDKYT